MRRVLASVAVALLAVVSLSAAASGANVDGRFYYHQGGYSVDVYVACATQAFVAQGWKGKLTGTNASYAVGSTLDELDADMVVVFGFALSSDARAALEQDVALGLCVT